MPTSAQATNAHFAPAGVAPPGAHSSGPPLEFVGSGPVPVVTFFTRSRHRLPRRLRSSGWCSITGATRLGWYQGLPYAASAFDTDERHGGGLHVAPHDARALSTRGRYPPLLLDSLVRSGISPRAAGLPPRRASRVLRCTSAPPRWVRGGGEPTSVPPRRINARRGAEPDVLRSRRLTAAREPRQCCRSTVAPPPGPLRRGTDQP